MSLFSSNKPTDAAIGSLAPELEPTGWLNSPPLRLADLRGRVTLLEFWTFDCINCRNVLPALLQWHRDYAMRGLVIIGIHTPEFRHEREAKNVQAAIQRFGIGYPVALDNDFGTWK